MIDLKERARNWTGLKGAELAKRATVFQKRDWLEKSWKWGEVPSFLNPNDAHYHVVCIDYGVKSNILKILANLGCKTTIMSADTSYEDILSLHPDGVLLSNGPGDRSSCDGYVYFSSHLQTCRFRDSYFWYLFRTSAVGPSSWS